MKFTSITESSLDAVVRAFYARVRRDELIGPVFNDAIDDWEEHLSKLQSFWSSIMLGSGRYKGRPLPAHVRHADRIGSRSFERWLALWKETTGAMFEAGPAAALHEKAERIADSLSLGIAFAADPEAALREKGQATGKGQAAA